MSASDSAGASAVFDAYYELLGIPPAEQPPTYYRLLGLSPFESNGKVIERATDRQISHLRSFKSGDAALGSQQLLNEIAKASRILLSPDEKEVYDRSLLRPGRISPAPMPPMPMPLQRPAMSYGPMVDSPQLLPVPPTTQLVQPIVVQVPSVPMGRAVPSQIHGAPTATIENRNELVEASNGQWLILVAGGIGCAVVLMIVVAARMLGSTEAPVTERQDKVTASASAGSVTSTPGLAPDRTAPSSATINQPPTIPPPPPENVANPPKPESPETAVTPVATSPAVAQTNPDGSNAKVDLPQPAKLDKEPKVEPIPRALPVGEWVDLFPLIKPKEDIVAGIWKCDGERMTAMGNGMSKLRLPADLGDTSYDLQVEFTSESDPNNINIILPVGDRSVLLVGDGYLDVGTVSGFSLIRDKEPIHVPYHIRGQMLKAGEKYKYDISVRLQGERAELTFLLNDERRFGYNGPIDDLRIIPVYRLADDGWPGLSTWFCPVNFLSCKLRLHDGPGRLTRALSDAKK